ncbi:MAG: sugar transferase [Clostridia bacterium]|nr:sugar transferase [Clostridia bacterium]
MRKFQLFIKRAFDIAVSIILLILLIAIPILIVVPIVIRLTSKGPAVFTQDRMGKGGKVFKLYKFRTMRIPEDSYDENGNMLEPKKRITKVGAFLRKTSIDELMQLFNIINGTMSFVGPRPTLPYQAERYNERQNKRHDMRPGITGWAQVNGRNDLTWSEKLEYDVEYVEKFSLWFDIKILFKTVGVVFKQDGIAFTKDDAINAKTPQNAASSEAPAGEDKPSEQTAEVSGAEEK